MSVVVGVTVSAAAFLCHRLDVLVGGVVKVVTVLLELSGDVLRVECNT